MASRADADVEMATSPPHAPAPFSNANDSSLLLNAVATGDLNALAARSSAASDDDADDERLLLTPFLPLLTRLDHSRSSNREGSGRSSTPQSHAISSLLVTYEQVNALRAYALVFQSLQLADIEHVVHQQLREAQQLKQNQGESSDVPPPAATSVPIYRKFENGDARERTCLVLAEVYTQSFLPQPSRATRESELFANEIYKDELAAILVNALTSPALQVVENGVGVVSPFSLSSVVRFCLNIPLGVELIESLVRNDPSVVDQVVDVVIASLAQIPESAEFLSGASSSSSPVELIHAQDACTALANLAPVYAVMVRTKLSEHCGSLWCIAIAFHLTANVTALQEDTAIFLFQMMKNEAKIGAASGTSAPVSAFSTYLSIALADNSEAQQQQVESELQRSAMQNLAVIREQLFESLSHATSPFDIVVVLNVYIGLLVSQASFHPSEHETLQLLRWFDKAAKDHHQQLLSSRVVSLAYVLVVLLCYPLAPSLNKIPSQREEATKAILTLSQQCIFSLYNTKAACPLFILTAVLLYTKSPSLLPFLASVINNDGLPVQALRVDFLHVFGDVVLKPILTENIMAREVLTFTPAMDFDAFDDEILKEMTLRGIYGLLCEKSFLRHQHGRALEEWVVTQLEQAVLPLHPLMVNLAFEWIENYVVAFEYPISQKPVLQLSIIPLRSSTLNKWLNAPCLAQRYEPTSVDCQGDEGTSETARAWAKGVLALTYGLQFNQRVRHAMMVAGSKISALSSDAYPASGDVCLLYELNEFPLRNILREVLANGGEGQAFEFVAPTLLRLLIEEFPHRVSPINAPSPALIGDKSELDELWLRKREQLLQATGQSSSRSLSSESWTALNAFVSELESAPASILVTEFEVIVDQILPSILMARKAQQQDGSITTEQDASMYSEIVFAQLSHLYETRVRHEHLQRSSLRMKLIHSICFPDLVFRHYQQRQQHGDRSISRSAALNHLVAYSQVVEEPFRLLSDAHDAVFQSPALLRVLLLLVQDFRDAANVHLKKQDPVLAPRKQLLQGGAGGTPAGEPSVAPSLLVTKTASIVQHMLVQECLIAHALLNKIVVTTDGSVVSQSQEDVQRECNRLLCDALDELLSDEQSTALLPQNLITAVHQQGYDSALIPLLIEHVPSMRSLWDHWMAQATAAAQSSSSNAQSSSGSRSSTTSSAQVKILNEFVAADACEKDLGKWKFRLQVFFTLCDKYIAANQAPVVLQTLKVVLNKLRSVLMTAIAASSSSSGMSKDATDGEELRRHAAFLEEVLPIAVAACAQHPELSAELVQFLLKLQKQSGSGLASGSSGTWRNGSANNGHRAGKDLDEVLRDAYALLLEQI